MHFIMEHEQMSYPEALKYLAKKYGIEIKERELSSEEKIAQSETPAISAVSLDCAMKKVSARLYTTLTIRPNTEGSAILK